MVVKEKDTYSKILEELAERSNSKLYVKHFGINTKNMYRVSIKDLRAIAKKVGNDHKLAIKLWDSDIREARILASMIDNSEQVTPEQMERWTQDFDSWDICDECCINLFIKTPFAYEKAIGWSNSDKEFVKRAGFVLMANLAMHNKNINKGKLATFVKCLESNNSEKRPIVKKAMKWASREIAKKEI